MMKQGERTLIKACNIASVAIMLLLILMQFMPFWINFGGEYMSVEQFQASQAEALLQEQEYVEGIREAANTIKANAEALMPTEATEPAETEATEPAETEATEPAETEATEPTKSAEELLNEIITLAGDSRASAGKAGELAANTSGEKVELVSIAKTVWFPNEVEPPMLGIHLLILVFGMVGAFFCLKNLEGTVNFVFPLLASVGGVWYWFSEAAHTGMLWQLHAVLGSLLVPVVLVFIVLYIRSVNRYFKEY